VHNTVDILLDLISKDSDSKSSLGMMRVQLESDMINMVSRKASARESMERRIEEQEGFTEVATTLSKMDALTRGEVTDANRNDRQLSKNALAKLNPPARRSFADISKQPVVRRNPRQQRQTRRAAYKAIRPKPQELDLVPHFNGFTFKHKTDRDWLGLSGGRSKKMYLGSTRSIDDHDQELRAETPIFGTPSKRLRKENDIVYFNSNQYVGDRYLTAQAVEAGYLLGEEKPLQGESVLEFTNRMLLERDANEMIYQAENRLLHALAKFSQAREIMRTVYSASTFTPPNMKWTSDERQWLFQCLTGTSDPPLPKEILDGGTASQLRSFIANLDDCPLNAFIADNIPSSPKNLSFDVDLKDGSTSSGTSDQSLNQPDVETSGKGYLEPYFLEASHLFPSFEKNKIADETRAELTVQETVATLLRASAIKRFLSIKARLAKVVTELDRRTEAGGTEQQPKPDEEFNNLSLEEMQDLFESVAMEVMEAQRSLYESDRSTDRVNSHLLDYSTTNSVRYRSSQAEIERLEKMMADYVSSLPDDNHKPDVPGDDTSYVFGSDEVSEEIDARFGGRDPDSYIIRGLPNGESKWA
jgi:hypothetical protein